MTDDDVDDFGWGKGGLTSGFLVGKGKEGQGEGKMTRDDDHDNEDDDRQGRRRQQTTTRTTDKTTTRKNNDEDDVHAACFFDATTNPVVARIPGRWGETF